MRELKGSSKEDRFGPVRALKRSRICSAGAHHRKRDASSPRGRSRKRMDLAVRRDTRKRISSSSDAESPKGGHVVTDRDHRKRVASRTAET